MTAPEISALFGRSLARQLLLHTLWRQAALLAVIAVVVWAVVQRATAEASNARNRAEVLSHIMDTLIDKPLLTPDAGEQANSRMTAS